MMVVGWYSSEELEEGETFIKTGTNKPEVLVF